MFLRRSPRPACPPESLAAYDHPRPAFTRRVDRAWRWDRPHSELVSAEPLPGEATWSMSAVTLRGGRKTGLAPGILTHGGTELSWHAARDSDLDVRLEDLATLGLGAIMVGRGNRAGA